VEDRPLEDRPVEDLLRELAPQVLGALVRRYGRFDLCEDAVQEALLAAARQWPDEGVPANPRGWLATVASRRFVDGVRSTTTRAAREQRTAPSEAVAAVGDLEVDPDRDDTLEVLLMCCHPALSPASQVALALRAVGGLTTAEAASAFLVPEPTMAQRISRAKATIRRSTIPFGMPTSDAAVRLPVALHVIYLIFNEGYAASGGESLQRVDLCREAIRLARAVHRARPDDAEVSGLLALMLLNTSRQAARTGPDGELIPLPEQDRTLWDRSAIDEGVALVSEALRHGALGPYQLQAAIAAVHAESPSDDATDWPQIVALYDVLRRVSPSPVVELNRAVAVAMVDGPEAGLALLDEIESDGDLGRGHRLVAARAHLLERAGRIEEARSTYRAAARLTSSLPERRHLEGRAARLGAQGADPDASP
jgi:RNA polymerase sigma factor (sigma-70 family)